MSRQSLHPQLGEQLPAGAAWHAPLSSQARYRAERVLGKGSFGTVYKAIEVNSGTPVAVKTVRTRESGREIQVLELLRGHPNIICLLGTFEGAEATEEDRTTNIVLEFIPDTLARIIKHHRYLGQCMDLWFVRLYGFQMLRGLGCLSRAGIIHRDLKPANLLVDPNTFNLRVCDFGTAKFAHDQEMAHTYVCSRFYRAPELILCAPGYNAAVDCWSAGCVIAEMLIGQPLFTGTNGVDQLRSICYILGTPTREELHAINPEYDPSVAFHAVEPIPWEQVLAGKAAQDAAELLCRLFQFDPRKRPQAMEPMAWPFFDDIRRHGASHENPGVLALAPEELADCSQFARQQLGPLVRQWLAGKVGLKA